MHTDAIVVPAVCRAAIARGNSPREASARAPCGARSLQPPPGTISKSGESERVPWGTIRVPWEAVMVERSVSVTSRTSKRPVASPAPANSSNGPKTSSSSHPS